MTDRSLNHTRRRTRRLAERDRRAADLNHRTVVQPCRVIHRPAPDQGSISRTEVLHEPTALVLIEAGVHPRHRPVRDRQISLRRSSDDEALTLECVVERRALGRYHVQRHRRQGGFLFGHNRRHHTGECRESVISSGVLTFIHAPASSVGGVGHTTRSFSAMCRGPQRPAATCASRSGLDCGS